MRKYKGFTLIELIVVLVILAIIALIVTPIILNIVDKAESSARKRSVDGYGKAAELAIATYRLENGHYPKTFDELNTEYSGSNVKCNEQYINKNGSVYLSKCYVDKVKVKNNKEWYHYGELIIDYLIGDIVTYNGIKFYVISNSNVSLDYVTLLKADPLTASEINKYGNGHVNRYTESSVGTSSINGGMAYYTSETCGYINGSYVTTGCTADYNESDIKYVVDAWAKDTIKSTDLRVDNNGYSARLITYEELIGDLGYNGALSGTMDNPPTENSFLIPYRQSYWYWTMSAYENSDYYAWNIHRNGSLYNDGTVYQYNDGAVRPVVNIAKIAI